MRRITLIEVTALPLTAAMLLLSSLGTNQSQPAAAAARVGSGVGAEAAVVGPEVENVGPLPAPAWLAAVLQPSSPTVRSLRAQTIAPDPNARITFYWGLKRPETKAERVALATATPGSKTYRRHLSPKTIRHRFGAKPATVTALKQVAAGYGIAVELDGTGVFARATGTVADFESLLNTEIVEVTVNDLNIYGPGSFPPLPVALQGLVTETAWLYAEQAGLAAETKTRPPLSPRYKPSPTNQGNPIRTCRQFKHTTAGQTYQQAALAYGTAKLRSRSTSRGSWRSFDPRLGIVALGEGFSPSSAKLAKDCFKWTNGSVEVSITDGMRTRLAEGAEGDLDVQMAGAMLSSSRRIDYYESLPVSIPAQFLAIAAAFNSRQRPEVLSISYAWCEPFLKAVGGLGAIAIANSIYARLGLAGTSVLVAAGDSGSDGCLRTIGSTSGRSVSYPASSPWVTAVGGTRIVFDKKNARRNEVVWNDSAFVGGSLSPTNNVIAGGGGKSVLFGRPAWQPKSVTRVSGNRAVPDLAAHSSLAPGWIVNVAGSFEVLSGTSAATPLAAASIALLAAQQKQAGYPSLGFLNPWLYDIRSPHGSVFFDIVAGNNDLTGNGCCKATRGYDLASGLGAPNFSALKNRIVAPGARS